MFTAGGALVTFGVMYGSLKAEQKSFKEAFIEFKESFSEFKDEVKNELFSMRGDIKAIDGRCAYFQVNGKSCERAPRKVPLKYSPEEVSGD